MATAQASKRDANGQHFVLQLLGATGGQLAPEQSADLARFDVEHFAQDFRVVSVSGQTRLHIVEVLGQDAFDYLHGNRLLPNLEPFFEGPLEVGLKLERRTESCAQNSFKAHTNAATSWQTPVLKGIPPLFAVVTGNGLFGRFASPI
jgi:hypothetical protein